MMMASRNEQGYVLMAVVIAITLVAAIALLISRESAINTDMAAGEAETDLARYVAEAGFNHALWQMQDSNCTGYPNPLLANFGPHSYDVAVTPTSGSPVSVSATGTSASGAAYTLDQDGVTIYAPPQPALVLQPGAADGKDAWLAGAQPVSNNGASTVMKVAETDNDRPVLEFDLSSVPSDVRVISAQMELYLESSTAAGSAELYALTKAWGEGTKTGFGIPDGVTWGTYDGTNAWSVAGGDYLATPLASQSLIAAPAWYSWDISSLVAHWIGGSQANYGVVLIGKGGIANTAFTSSDSADSVHHPRLTIIYACECGGACGGGP